MFKKFTLKSGLRIIVVPQKSTQAVTVLVLVGTGSKYEQKERNGISHFLEHMFFKGTKKRPDKVEIAETLDCVGGVYNAFTGQEYTGYWAKVKAEHFELALDWVSDIFLNSLLPQNEIEKELGVIMQEINMRYDDPMSYVQELWQQVLYGDQPAGWPIAGTKESIGNVNRRHLIDYMENQYKASNTVVCVAGNVKISDVIKRVGHYFASIQRGEFQHKPAVKERQQEPQVLLHERKTDQTHLCIGVRGYNLFHPMKYAYELTGVLLGGMMSSRLFVEVREKLGIAYYIRTDRESDTDTGFLVTCAGVEHQSVKKAITVILREYKKMAQKKIGQKELRKAKDYLKGTTALALESSDAKASFYGMQELLEQRILTPEDIYKRIEAVTASQIQAVARDIFRPEKLNLAIVGPHTADREFKELLTL
jgi:predicted Zn-dependent peptidase